MKPFRIFQQRSLWSWLIFLRLFWLSHGECIEMRQNGFEGMLVHQSAGKKIGEADWVMVMSLEKKEIHMGIFSGERKRWLGDWFWEVKDGKELKILKFWIELLNIEILYVMNQKEHGFWTRSLEAKWVCPPLAIHFEIMLFLFLTLKSLSANNVYFIEATLEQAINISPCHLSKNSIVSSTL